MPRACRSHSRRAASAVSRILSRRSSSNRSRRSRCRRRCSPTCRPSHAHRSGSNMPCRGSRTAAGVLSATAASHGRNFRSCSSPSRNARVAQKNWRIANKGARVLCNRWDRTMGAHVFNSATTGANSPESAGVGRVAPRAQRHAVGSPPPIDGPRSSDQPTRVRPDERLAYFPAVDARRREPAASGVFPADAASGDDWRRERSDHGRASDQDPIVLVRRVTRRVMWHRAFVPVCGLLIVVGLMLHWPARSAQQPENSTVRNLLYSP